VDRSVHAIGEGRDSAAGKLRILEEQKREQGRSLGKGRDGHVLVGCVRWSQSSTAAVIVTA
jgi:hypothetical protein